MGSHSFGVELKGFDAIEKLLKIDPDSAKRVIREALRKALAPVLAEVLANIPVDSGDLKRSLVISIPKTKKKTLIRVEIQAGKIPGHPDEWEAYYGLFVEYGTLNKDGTTRIPPNPIMRRAYASQNANSLAIAEREILAAITQIIIRKAA